MFVLSCTSNPHSYSYSVIDLTDFSCFLKLIFSHDFVWNLYAVVEPAEITGNVFGKLEVTFHEIF